MTLKKSIVVLLSSSLLWSCSLENVKFDSQGIGTIAGGILGGALGNAACDGSDQQELCTLVGLAAGAYIGNHIGKKLDQRDRERHAQATAAALASHDAEPSAGWEDKEKGTAGKVTVVKQAQKNTADTVPVLKDRVETVMPLELIGEVYATDKSLNVRVGPGTEYKIASEPLPPGSQFNVVGRVIERPDWLMISKQGAATGYVYGPLTAATGLATAMVAPVDEPGVQRVPVQTVSTCKTVNHQITYENGQTETETVEMCQRGDGSWDIV